MSDRGEFGRGWRFVLGGFVGIAGGFASLYFYTAGLFIKPMSDHFGWTRGEASLGALAFTAANVIALPVAGRLVDRYGELRVAFASGMLLAVSFAMMGLLVNGLVSFLALVTILSLVSAGSNAIGYNRVIVRHFVERRGLALGLALTGMAFGAAVLPPFLAPMIAQQGWRLAYYLLAGLAVVLTSAASLLIRERAPAIPPQSQQQEQASWREISRHPAFLSTSAMILLSSSAVLGTTLHLVPLLSDSGLSPVQAGTIASALGISVLFGRIGAGYLLDRWDAGWVAFALLLLAACGALLLRSGEILLLVPGAMLIGFGVGTEGDLLAFLLGRRFPVRQFGSVYGTIFAIHAFGGGLGGYVAGWLVDMTQGYSLWLAIAAVALVIAATIALLTERGVQPIVETSPLEAH